VPRRPPVAALALLLATACTSGTSGGSGEPSDGVQVAAVNGSSSDSLLSCRALKNLAPKDLANGVTRRTALPVSDTTAAWGDPAVTLRCGVPEGSDLDEPLTINDVLWAVHDTGASRTWTTRGRKVNVAVEVPDSYTSQGELFASLADAVKTALR
jgi:hypothetical protein